jgi:glycosyltransferase involved in cell wall biosynthesis
MISVCMAAKNGERFIVPQIDSILSQLTAQDEIIISDDHSTDHTVAILNSYQDPRIRVIVNPKKGLISNFENALSFSRGEIIFLSDQDDVWMPDKVKNTLPFFNEFDLLVSDCKIVNDKLDSVYDSFFEYNSSGKGVFRNLFRNSYMGCCMAFKRSLLKRALPFPPGLIMHDQWLGLMAELSARVLFIPDQHVLHRRHNQNASTTASGSHQSLLNRISNRYFLIKNLIYAK